jgi:hypothetical protein
MYALVQKNGHAIWRERWYAFTSRISLWIDFYMTRENHVFITDVVVTDPTWEMVALNVMSWPIGEIAKLNVVVKIRKYRGLHEGHHFILMAMEVHNTPGRDMDHFIKECARLSHNRWSKCHLCLSFCIQFFKQCVSIVLECPLTFTIERKITLIDDACSKPPITIKSHDLHVGNIRRVVGDIASYHERD